MAVTYNTEAIVLRREDWNSNDSRLTLYTKARGKIEAVARGLRKAKSKLAAHLEPLTFAEIFLVEGRRYQIVAGSSVLDRHIDLVGNLARLASAGLVLRIVDLMTPFENHDERIFELITSTLKALEGGSAVNDVGAGRIAHLFAWKLMLFSGYHPELRNCLECQKPLNAEQVAINVRRGGVMHQVCVKTTNNIVTVSFAAIKGLAYMVEAPINDAIRLRSANGALAEINMVIEALIEERFEVGAGSQFWAKV